MSDLQHNGTLEGLSVEVIASDRHDAERVAKVALIQNGRTPGHCIFAEQISAGTWEVVYTNRPLRIDQVFGKNGTRIGNAGSRADAVLS